MYRPHGAAPPGWSWIFGPCAHLTAQSRGAGTLMETKPFLELNLRGTMQVPDRGVAGEEGGV